MEKRDELLEGDGMSCEKCQRVAELIRVWRDREGDDVCWYYPVIFAEIVAEVGLDLLATDSGMAGPTICREQFHANWMKFEEELYGQ